MVSFKCTVTGDEAVSVRWFLCGHDITDRSLGSSYIQGKTTSQLEVNYASISDILLGCDLKCDDTGETTLQCTADVSCNGVRPNSEETRKTQAMKVYVSKSTSPQQSDWLIVLIMVVRLAVCLTIGCC